MPRSGDKPDNEKNKPHPYRQDFLESQGTFDPNKEYENTGVGTGYEKSPRGLRDATLKEWLVGTPPGITLAAAFLGGFYQATGEFPHEPFVDIYKLLTDESGAEEELTNLAHDLSVKTAQSGEYLEYVNDVLQGV